MRGLRPSHFIFQAPLASEDLMFSSSDDSDTSDSEVESNRSIISSLVESLVPSSQDEEEEPSTSEGKQNMQSKSSKNLAGYGLQSTYVKLSRALK